MKAVEEIVNLENTKHTHLVLFFKGWQIYGTGITPFVQLVASKQMYKGDFGSLISKPFFALKTSAL